MAAVPVATIHTIGHSTRSAAQLIAMLGEVEIAALADVRRFPASRRHPQHNRGALEESLAADGAHRAIAQQWLDGARLPLLRRRDAYAGVPRRDRRAGSAGARSPDG